LATELDGFGEIFMTKIFMYFSEPIVRVQEGRLRFLRTFQFSCEKNILKQEKLPNDLLLRKNCGLILYNKNSYEISSLHINYIFRLRYLKYFW